MKIFELLNITLFKSPTPSQINLLVETSIKIAKEYIRRISSKLGNIKRVNEINDLDLAIDSIALLFSRNDKGELYVLKKSFESWQPKITTDEEALFFLNKIIANKVEQRISALLKELNPHFADTLDSINYLIKKYHYHKVNYLGTAYILPNNNQIINGKVIEPEKFDYLPAELFTHHSNFLQKLFDYLKSENFIAAIPINSLVKKLISINSNNYTFTELVQNDAQNLQLNEMVQEGLDTAIRKLDECYVPNHKLTITEANRFRKALNDIANDLKDGGTNPGLYEYLHKYMTELTKEEYQSNYHNILEYLVRLMKEKIRLTIKN